MPDIFIEVSLIFKGLVNGCNWLR